MIVGIREEAERELEAAFDYYELRQPGLGQRFLNEFRRGIERVQQYPTGWQALDVTYRRYRLNHFPYGIVYRLDTVADRIVIVAIMHLSRRPDQWRENDRT